MISLKSVDITLKQIKAKRNRKRRLRQARITRIKKAAKIRAAMMSNRRDWMDAFYS